MNKKYEYNRIDDVISFTRQWNEDDESNLQMLKQSFGDDSFKRHRTIVTITDDISEEDLAIYQNNDNVYIINKDNLSTYKEVDAIINKLCVIHSWSDANQNTIRDSVNKTSYKDIEILKERYLDMLNDYSSDGWELVQEIKYELPKQSIYGKITNGDFFMNRNVMGELNDGYYGFAPELKYSIMLRKEIPIKKRRISHSL